LIAWEKKGIGAGALVVRTDSLSVILMAGFKLLLCELVILETGNKSEMNDVC
jgi:hypothetical protein